MTENELIGVRDPHGFRPLCLGRLDDAWVLSSETCALDLIGAEYVRDVKPGELITIDSGGLQSEMFAQNETGKLSHCIFEHVYFARPDSEIFGQGVHSVRLALGERLAIEHPVDADLVIPVPDSGRSAAIGFSRKSGIPIDRGFVVRVAPGG